MAKNSGTTRNSTPTAGTERATLPPARFRDYYTEEEENAIINAIAKGGFVNFGDNHEVWTDVMNVSQRELMLMLAGFNGLTNEELETQGSFYVPAKIDDLLSEIVEDLRNEVDGYGMDDSTMWTIGYKDGTTKHASLDDVDFDLTGVTNRANSRQVDQRIRKRLNPNKIAFVIKSNGYEEPRYYATEKGLPMLKEYGGFEEWKNGRGEKGRSYIQDDWI